MANKDISRMLSGLAIVLCVILLCSPDITGQQQFRIKKLTFTISGSVGLSGVMINGLPGNPVTNENGYYSAAVEFNWSGKVTPVKIGYTFDPPYITYNNVRSNLDKQDYIAELQKFTISGVVGQAGVVMAGLPGNPVSSNDGMYKAIVEYGWSGTVAPEKAGFTFTPPTKNYSQVNRNYSNESFTAVPIMFEITGSAGVSGVAMSGLPKPTISDTSSNYRAEVPYGWSGTITPEKVGYSFNPSNRIYSNVINAQTYQDYVSEEITFIISGTTGEPRVVMKGLPDNPITNVDGTYTAVVKYGFSGKVTPEKGGFNFKPPGISYLDVKHNMDNQNYTAEEITYIISGSVGQEGIEMVGLPGNPVSGSGGAYKATIPYGWSGTVTPTKEGLTFTPDHKMYPSVTANLTNEDYSAIPITFTISGTTGVAGIVIKGLPGRVITDENGYYSAPVIYGWNGTIIPEKPGYTFEPSSRNYPRLISAEVNQDYISTLERRTISGRVTSNQGPIVGVVVVADAGGGSTTTNANGEFNISVDYGWTGTMQPESEGYTFQPAYKRYPRIIKDQMNQDFTAEVIMLTISGTLEMGGVPLEGILMSASEGGVSATTDAKGNYSVKVPYGWTGEISPKKEGYSFDPPSEMYTNVTTDYKDGQPVMRKPVTPGARTPETTMSGLPPLGPVVPESTTTSQTLPPEIVRQQPVVEVPTMPGLQQFDQQKTLLGTEMGNLQQKMDDILRQLSGEKPVGPNLPPTAGPRVPGRAPSVIQTQIPKVAKGPLISISCIDRDIRQVLKEISEQTGIGVYPDDTVKGTATCHLVNMPLEDALVEILKGTGLRFKEIPNSYLVYKPITNTFADNDLRDVLATIAVDAGVVIVPDATVGGMVTADLKEVPLETALDIVLAGSSFVVKKTPDYYLVASSKLDSEAFPAVSETRRVKMNYVEADTAVRLLSTAFRPYVQAEAILDPATGNMLSGQTLLITAPAVLANRIVSDLKQIDQAPRHVMLDARIVIMDRGDLLNLGIEWGWPNISAGIFGSDFREGGDDALRFGGKWPWGVQIGYTPDAIFTSSLLMTLNLLSQNGEADIVSSPQVLAQDGRQAQLRVMNEEYYYLTAGEAATFFAEAQLETIEAGTSLTITPRIGDNNDITLEIAAEVSDVVARGRQTEEVLPLVTVTRRTATNTVRVKDGGTVALAGLKENKRVTENKRTPGLSSIPIIGSLFNNKRDQTSTREVLVLITARLVPEMGQMVEETGPAELSTGMIPPGSMGQNEFKMRLQESLSRLR